MLKLIRVTTLLAFYTSLVTAGHVAGYHYEKPSISLGLVAGTSNLGHGHSFGPLPTVQPLPPVPALPALPTPRSKGQFVQTQTIYQTHPVATLKQLPNSYLPSSGTSIGKIAQQYQSPLLAQQSATSSVRSQPIGTGFSSPSAAVSGLGSNLPNPAPAAAQPLRVPFGKQAIISFPSTAAGGSSYESHGRELKQYAVIEIIDNDIEQNTQPFLNSPFIAGAITAPYGGEQIASRSSALHLGQQRLAPQLNSNDAVALGSGGLGFIRLANGKVYLGSGSLGYVSGQQHNQEINDALTRSGAPQPDALHFGHGPLGASNRFNKFSFRFK